MPRHTILHLFYIHGISYIRVVTGSCYAQQFATLHSVIPHEGRRKQQLQFPTISVTSDKGQNNMTVTGEWRITHVIWLQRRMFYLQFFWRQTSPQMNFSRVYFAFMEADREMMTNCHGLEDFSWSVTIQLQILSLISAAKKNLDIMNTVTDIQTVTGGQSAAFNFLPFLIFKTLLLAGVWSWAVESPPQLGAVYYVGTGGMSVGMFTSARPTTKGSFLQHLRAFGNAGAGREGEV